MKVYTTYVPVSDLKEPITINQKVFINTFDGWLPMYFVGFAVDKLLTYILPFESLERLRKDEDWEEEEEVEERYSYSVYVQRECVLVEDVKEYLPENDPLEYLLHL